MIIVKMKTPIYAYIDEVNIYNIYLALHDDYIFMYSYLMKRINNEVLNSDLLKGRYFIY